MSSGFRHLQNDKLEQAREAFTEALRLLPNSKDATAALGQTEHNITARKINVLLDQARQFEEKEAWRQAVEKYQAVLRLNADLGNAQQGLERSRQWAEAHKKIDRVLAKPQLLYDKKSLDENTAFLAALEKVSQPGQKLGRKISRFRTAVNRAGTPVRVRLVSDNETDVTLYKVSKLGLFVEHELMLRPGNYVAVGKREGYRDVRVEFLVRPEATMAPVSVISREKIALGQ